MVWTMEFYVSKANNFKRPFMTDINEFDSEKERDERISHLKDIHGDENVIVAPSKWEDTTNIAIIWRN